MLRHFVFRRNYAEEIENRLISSGIRTSIRLLREDVKLTDAIENARIEQCLYAMIVMPMHEERRTASFHILYGQTEGLTTAKKFPKKKILFFRTSKFNIGRWFSHHFNELFIV